MDAIIFLLILVAAVVAVRARRSWLTLLFFGIAFVAAALLFEHHVTDPLGVSL